MNSSINRLSVREQEEFFISLLGVRRCKPEQGRVGGKQQEKFILMLHFLSL